MFHISISIEIVNLLVIISRIQTTWWWHAGGQLWCHSICSKMTINGSRQIRHEKYEWSTRFSELKENRVDHTFWLHLWKNKQKMKTRWTTNSLNKAIWLDVSFCHMTMTRKINKLEKLGGPQGNFHALFGRSATVYGHFRADAVTSEWSTRISPSSTNKQPKNKELLYINSSNQIWTKVMKSLLQNINLLISVTIVEWSTSSLIFNQFDFLTNKGS